MGKVKYEKPMSLDAGQVAAIQGASCSDGTLADAGKCRNGIDPNMEPYCDTTGAVATGNCETLGSSAGKTCYQTGASANPGFGCSTGGNTGS